MQAIVAEIGASQMECRLTRLEDPISTLHPDVPEVTGQLYDALRQEDDAHIHLEVHLYEQFSKALAVLEAQGCIKGLHSWGHRYSAGIRVVDPTFTMYMAARHEKQRAMKALIERIETCERGKWIHGGELKAELALPLPVIAACFDVFEMKGYGLRSRELGRVAYVGRA